MLQLKSPAFEDGERIPTKYANKAVAGGGNISVPLFWENPPAATKSFCITIIDKHRIANDWVHWLVINIPASTTSVPEGASGTSNMPTGAQELNNTFGSRRYGGPQPPPGTGDHDYQATIYALDVEKVTVALNATERQFIEAIQGHILSSDKITGTFSR